MQRMSLPLLHGSQVCDCQEDWRPQSHLWGLQEALPAHPHCSTAGDPLLSTSQDLSSMMAGS